MPDVVSLGTANALFAALMMLGGALLMLGFFFTGIDGKPANFVMKTMSYIFKWLGIGIIIAAAFVFLGAPLGQSLSTWLGTLLLLLGVALPIVAHVFNEGGDFKPVAWLFLALGLIAGLYAVMTPSALDLATNLGKDIFILCILVAVSAVGGFIAIRLFPGGMAVAGIPMLAAGADALYISIRYLFATVGIGAF